MAQYALPDANISITNWSEGAGDADADWFDELDEGFGAGRGSGSGPDDATSYWYSAKGPGNFAGNTIGTALSSVTDPSVHTGHFFRARNQKHSSGGQQIDVRIRLEESGVMVAEGIFTTTLTWTTNVLSLTEAEAANITDYTALEGQTAAKKVGGGAPRAARESAHEFECPDAGPSAAAKLQPGLTLMGKGHTL